MHKLLSLAFVVASLSNAYALEPSAANSSSKEMFASVDRVNRRTCPSSECGVVGQLFYRESVKVYEAKEGWARITKYYDASCSHGASDYVDSGPKSCVANNGIVDGKFAEWVSIKLLSNVRPADPATNAEGDFALVKGSDDYGTYKDIFASAARKLINEGKCTARDFVENGGWIKSTTTYANRPVYFTYCGGATVSSRLYLDASNGKVFR